MEAYNDRPYIRTLIQSNLEPCSVGMDVRTYMDLEVRARADHAGNEVSKNLKSIKRQSSPDGKSCAYARRSFWPIFALDLEASAYDMLFGGYRILILSRCKRADKTVQLCKHTNKESSRVPQSHIQELKIENGVCKEITGSTGLGRVGIVLG